MGFFKWPTLYAADTSDSASVIPGAASFATSAPAGSLDASDTFPTTNKAYSAAATSVTAFSALAISHFLFKKIGNKLSFIKISSSYV